MSAARQAHIAAVAKPVKTWRILGPFIIGKNELDGDASACETCRVGQAPASYAWGVQTFLIVPP